MKEMMDLSDKPAKSPVERHFLYCKKAIPMKQLTNPYETCILRMRV